MMKYINLTLVGLVLIAVSKVSAVTQEEIQKIQQAMPDKPAVEASVQQSPRTLLVFNLSNGFQHSCIPYWQKALEIMGQKTGAFKVEQSSDMSVFNEESLKAFDAICFNNTTNLTPDAVQQKAIMEFIESGKGIVGIHAATDNFGNWPEGMMMVGGVFKGHPWTAEGTWAIKIDDPQHPLMMPFEGKGFKVNDEIYRTVPPHYSRATQRVLMSLDMSDPDTKNVKGLGPEDIDTGISWVKPVGKGRLFYCSLGHNHHLTWSRPVLEHYLAGIQYALGDLKVDDSPIKSAATLDAAKVDALLQQIVTYGWDKSRAPLAEMETLVRAQSGNPESLKLIEGKILGALQAECMLAAKDFFCRMLAIIGTDDSVPVLSKMLEDDSTFDMALFALDGNAGQEAESAILSHLHKETKPAKRAGLITSLGRRKSDRAFELIARLTKVVDETVAEAAIAALGAIGTQQAVNALEDLEVKAGVQDALLRCADSAYKAGNTNLAQEIYGKLYAQPVNLVIKAGALLGLSKTGDPDASEYVLSALTGDEPMLVRAAVRAICTTEDKGLLQKAAEIAEKVSPQVQVQLLTGLSENKMKIGGSVAEKLAASPQKDVRIASYNSLARLENEQSVILLGRVAGSVDDKDERQAARDALYFLKSDKVDESIITAISDQSLDEQVRIEMITAAVERQNTNAVKALLQTARADNKNVAGQSMRALGQLAGPDNMQELIELVIAKPGTYAENALVAAAMKITDKNKRASGIIAQYKLVEDNKAKASLLHVMGKLGDKNSVDIMDKEFASADPVISDAAFKGISEWPGNEFTAKMKDTAQNSPAMKRKILAFRAYVRMLGPNSKGLIEAFKMAERPEEQKIVIAALANTTGAESLEFLRKISDEAHLKTEAQLSLVSVCQKMAEAGSSEATVVLKKLSESGANDTVKKRASDVLEKNKL